MHSDPMHCNIKVIIVILWWKQILTIASSYRSSKYIQCKQTVRCRFRMICMRRGRHDVPGGPLVWALARSPARSPPITRHNSDRNSQFEATLFCLPSETTTAITKQIKSAWLASAVSLCMNFYLNPAFVTYYFL